MRSAPHNLSARLLEEEQVPQKYSYSQLVKNSVFQNFTEIKKIDEARKIILVLYDLSKKYPDRIPELIRSILYLKALVADYCREQKNNWQNLKKLNVLLENFDPERVERSTHQIHQRLNANNQRPKHFTYAAKPNNRIKHYSNMSDDKYGIDGAFADMMDSIADAKQMIFLQGWMFEPEVVLPVHGVLRDGLRHQAKVDEAIAQGDFDIARAAIPAAADEFAKAIQAQPGNSWAQYFAGIAQMYLGNFEIAENYFRRASELEPKCEDFYHALLICFINQKKFDQVEPLIQQASRNKVIFKTANLLIVYAEFCIKQNKLKKAMRLLRLAETTNPHNINLKRLRAAVYEKQGKISAARETLDEYLCQKRDDIAALQYAHLRFLEAKSEEQLRQIIADYHYPDRIFTPQLNQIGKDIIAAYLRLNEIAKAKEILSDEAANVADVDVADWKREYLQIESKHEVTERISETRIFWNFSESFNAYKHNQPTLGEVLIKKAIDNPEMLIAINLWNNQFEENQEVFPYLEKIAKEKFNLEKLPDNLLVRMISKEGYFKSFHQKYLVTDDGNQRLKTFYGGSDLAKRKFDWHEHALIDTPKTKLWEAYAANDWQNSSLAFPSHERLMPRVGWRDLQSQAQGPICHDFASDFVAHWGAGKGEAFTGYKVDVVSNRRVAQHWQQVSQTLQQEDKEEMKSSGPFWQSRVVRSVEKRNYAEWKLPTDHENSIQHAYIEAIKKAENFIYIENQFFSGDLKQGNAVARALIAKICQKAARNEPFHVYITLPMCPNGEPGGKFTVEPLRHTQWTLMQKMMQEIEQRTGKHSSVFLSFNFYAKWHGVADNYNDVRAREKFIPPRTRGEYFCTRRVKKLAYKLLNDIKPEAKTSAEKFSAFLNRVEARQEENSGFRKFLHYLSQKISPAAETTREKQSKADKLKREKLFYQKQLIIDLVDLLKVMRATQQWTPVAEQAERQARIDRLLKLARLINAKQKIPEFYDDYFNQLLIEFNGPSRADLVSAGRRAPIYLHSKFMLVDDKIMINGSANLNARSMVGKDADAEIAVIQEPQAGHEEACFHEAQNFRQKIWRAYFGEQLMAELDADGFANPHLPEHRAKIQRRAETNFQAFTSNEPGQCSDEKTGLLCSWPFAKAMRKVGELEGDRHYFPDTPSYHQHPNSVYRYFSQEGKKPIAKKMTDVFGFRPFY